MGLLDDAIREHLDLKRRHGADASELERAEREALGPVRRDPFEPGDGELEAEAARPAADEEDEGVFDDEYYEDEELEEEEEGDEEWAAEEDEPPRPPEDALPADVADPVPVLSSDEAPAEEPAAATPPLEPSVPAPHRAGAEAEPPVSAPEPHFEAEEPSQPPEERALAGEKTVEYDIEEELGSHELEDLPPLEPPVREDERAEHPGGSAAGEHAAGAAPAHPDEPGEDDVLEETPEFLQDTPDHDRLWFEQRPPRDFDFDG